MEFQVINLPQGLMATANAAANVTIYGRHGDSPVYASMTGYGQSYLAKVMTGMDRLPEAQLVFIDNKNRELQVSITIDDPDTLDIKKIVRDVIQTLPAKHRVTWAKPDKAYRVKVRKVKIGFVKEAV